MMFGFLLRRIVTVLLCAGSFWLGIKTEGLLNAGRCHDGGGRITSTGLCIGAGDE